MFGRFAFFLERKLYFSRFYHAGSSCLLHSGQYTCANLLLYGQYGGVCVRGSSPLLPMDIRRRGARPDRNCDQLSGRSVR